VLAQIAQRDRFANGLIQILVRITLRIEVIEAAVGNAAETVVDLHGIAQAQLACSSFREKLDHDGELYHGWRCGELLICLDI